MRVTIAYSKIKKQNLVSVNSATYQREILSEWPIPVPLSHLAIGSPFDNNQIGYHQQMQ